METIAVATENADAADDPAIWAPASGGANFDGRVIPGFVIGTDKRAGLYVYGLDGRELQFLPEGLLNNVDLRDGFAFGGRSQLLIGASDRGTRKGVALYLFDPAATASDNRLRPAGFVASDVAEPYGFCMGRRSDTHVAVLIAKDGQARQYRIAAEGDRLVGIEERRFAVGSQSEGCVVDDQTAMLYVGEEQTGVWRYSLDPASGDARTLIAPADGRRLVADVEGVTLIRDGGATYLIVSSQGDSAFPVWQVDGPSPQYRGRIRVDAAGSIDAVTGTDGIDGFSGPIGDYREGVLVVQDDVDTGGTQNFKLVDWARVRKALGL